MAVGKRKGRDREPNKEYGISGVLRGATDSFFGFLGFDAVCALALDTKDRFTQRVNSLVY